FSSHHVSCLYSSFSFFNATATSEIYTLSLHDALPIFHVSMTPDPRPFLEFPVGVSMYAAAVTAGALRLSSRILNFRPKLESRKRSEEHTSELQSRSDLVCRLLLEKKNK